MKPLFRSTTQNQTHSRSGIAFIIEMLVLLVFVCGCFAILVQMFAYSQQLGERNYKQVQAIDFASDIAEAFSADPLSVPEVEILDDLVAYTTIAEEPQSTGTLYTADITVYSVDKQEAGELSFYYELETARYVRLGEA